MNKNKTALIKLSCPKVTALEKKVLTHIFRAILEYGKASTIDDLQLSLKKSIKSIIQVLDELEEKDLLLRGKGTQQIISIYPFSLRPTKHQVVLEDGKKLFAMCAVDALGVSNMFNLSIKTISRCEHCSEKITVEIKNGQIVSKSHPHIQIWRPIEQKFPAAETCCPMINFFCSKQHLKEWKDKNPDLLKKGQSLFLEEGYPRIKELWKRYGKRIGVR